MRGAPLKSVQNLRGHADIKMKVRYAHLTPRTRQEAIDHLDIHLSESQLGLT